MTTETSTPSRQRDPWNTAVVQKKTGHAIRDHRANPQRYRRVAGYGRTPGFIGALRMTGTGAPRSFPCVPMKVA